MEQKKKLSKSTKCIVIMAAGMGSRYGGLKQIDEMGPNGEILMEYSIFDAIKAGFNRVVFIITQSMREEFDLRIGKRLRPYINVDYAIQDINDLPPGFSVPEGRTKPWGTGQAILSAKNLINTPFAVFNADDFYGAGAFRAMAAYLDSISADKFESSMVGFPIEKTLSPYGKVTRGICRSENGYLSQVTEIAEIGFNTDSSIHYTENGKSFPLTGEELCSMNFWGFTPLLFDFLEKDFVRFLKEKGGEQKSEWLIPTIVDDMIKQNATKVKVLESNDRWFGVTYPEDKPEVVSRISSLIEQGTYPTPLFPE